MGCDVSALVLSIFDITHLPSLAVYCIIQFRILDKWQKYSQVLPHARKPNTTSYSKTTKSQGQNLNKGLFLLLVPAAKIDWTTIWRWRKECIQLAGFCCLFLDMNIITEWDSMMTEHYGHFLSWPQPQGKALGTQWSSIYKKKMHHMNPYCFCDMI